jgi:hypothetical protein
VNARERQEPDMSADGNDSDGSGDSGEGGRPDRPLLRIVRGTPDDVELAALTAVVAGLAVGAAEQDAPESGIRSGWADRASLVRRPATHGPRAWRVSGLPR